MFTASRPSGRCPAFFFFCQLRVCRSKGAKGEEGSPLTGLLPLVVVVVLRRCAILLGGLLALYVCSLLFSSTQIWRGET